MEWGRGQGWLAVGGGCEEDLKVPDRLFVLCVFFFSSAAQHRSLFPCCNGDSTAGGNGFCATGQYLAEIWCKDNGRTGIGRVPLACVCRATTLGSQGRWLGLLEVRCIGCMCEWPGREPRLSNGNRQRKEASAGRKGETSDPRSQGREVSSQCVLVRSIPKGEDGLHASRRKTHGGKSTVGRPRATALLIRVAGGDARSQVPWATWAGWKGAHHPSIDCPAAATAAAAVDADARWTWGRRLPRFSRQPRFRRRGRVGLWCRARDFDDGGEAR